MCRSPIIIQGAQSVKPIVITSSDSGSGSPVTSRVVIVGPVNDGRQVNDVNLKAVGMYVDEVQFSAGHGQVNDVKHDMDDIYTRTVSIRFTMTGNPKAAGKPMMSAKSTTDISMTTDKSDTANLVPSEKSNKPCSCTLRIKSSRIETAVQLMTLVRLMTAGRSLTTAPQLVQLTMSSRSEITGSKLTMN